MSFDPQNKGRQHCSLGSMEDSGAQSSCRFLFQMSMKSLKFRKKNKEKEVKDSTL